MFLFGFFVSRSNLHQSVVHFLYWTIIFEDNLFFIASIFNLFVYRQFSGFGSCSGFCCSKNVTVNVYIGNLDLNFFEHDKKIYTFQYTNKNCDKLQWTTWSETVSCQTLSHAVYARRRCVDCDGVDYPDRRYCYGNETKQIPCRNLILTDINPSEHSNTNRSTNRNDQSWGLFSNLMIIGGVGLIVLVIICKCKSKLKFSSILSCWIPQTSLPDHLFKHTWSRNCSNRHVPRTAHCIGLNQQHMYMEVE